MADRHLIDSIGFQTVDMGARVVLGGVGPASHQIDQTTQSTQSAAPYVENHFITDAIERFNFQSFAVGTVLENLGLLGPNCINTATAGVGLDLFGRKLSDCGVGGRASGSSHLRTRATLARIFVQSLRIDGSGNAIINLEGVLLSADGDAAPSATIYNAALETAILGEEWRRGIVKVDDLTLRADAIQSIALECRNEYRITQGTGIEAVGTVFTKARPMLTITTEETDLYDASRLPRSKQVAAADTFFVLRQRDATTGKLISAASYVHKMIAMGGLMKVTTPVSGDSETPSTCTVTIDGANATSGTSPIAVTHDVDATGAEDT